MARFTTYEPGPVPGSYAFLDEESGKTNLMYGPEAEAFKRRLDMQQDMRVAGPGAPGPAPATFGEDTEAAQAAAPPTPPAPVQPVRVPWRSTTGGGIIYKTVDPATGKEVAPPQVVTRGSPGTSHESLKKAAPLGVAFPSGARDTVEGGYDKDQAYLDQLKATAEKREQSAVEVAAAETRALEAQQGVFRNRKLLAAVEQDIEKNKAAEIEQRVARDRDAYDGAVEAVRGKKVDANRLFSGGGGTARLLAISIGQALSGYSDRMLGRQGNSWQIVQAAIDRDIAEQEHEIASGNKNVDNALARLTRSTGDINQAKLLLKQLQSEFSLAEAEEIGSKAKSDIVNAKIDQVRSEIQLGYQATREEYERLAAGKHTAQVEAKYAYPKAGTAGGVRPISLQESGTIIEQEGKGLGIRKLESDIANTDASTEKLKAEAKGVGSGRGPTAQDKAQLSGATATLNNTLKGTGLAWDDDKQTITRTGKDFAGKVGKDDVAGIGVADQYAAKLPLPHNPHALSRQDLMFALNNYRLQITGQGMSDAERQNIENTVFGAGTEEAAINGLRNIIIGIQARSKSMQGGGVGQVEEGVQGELPEPDEVTR